MLRLLQWHGSGFTTSSQRGGLTSGYCLPRENPAGFVLAWRVQGLGFQPEGLGHGKCFDDVCMFISTETAQAGKRLRRSLIIPPSFMCLQISDFSSNFNYPALSSTSVMMENQGRVPGFSVLAPLLVLKWRLDQSGGVSIPHFPLSLVSLVQGALLTQVSLKTV